MKLGDFLSNVPPATGSAGRERVDFRLLSFDSQGNQLAATGFACFCLASDKDEQEADMAAVKFVQTLRDASTPVVPEFIFQARSRAELLSRVLRDWDDPRERFAADADALQRHIPRHDLEQIAAAYEKWVESNYPKVIDKKQRDDLKGEAVKK